MGLDFHEVLKQPEAGGGFVFAAAVAVTGVCLSDEGGALPGIAAGQV